MRITAHVKPTDLEEHHYWTRQYERFGMLNHEKDFFQMHIFGIVGLFIYRKRYIVGENTDSFGISIMIVKHSMLTVVTMKYFSMLDRDLSPEHRQV